MDFYIKIAKIGNGYLLSYPTGFSDSPTPFFMLRNVESQSWYCKTQKEVEQVLPQIAMEAFARFEKTKAEKKAEEKEEA